MGYKILKVVEDELSADEFRKYVSVEPTEPPQFAIGDIVNFTDRICAAQGVVSAITWSEGTYSYTIKSAEASEPEEIRTSYHKEVGLDLLDAYV